MCSPFITQAESNTRDIIGRATLAWGEPGRAADTKIIVQALGLLVTHW